MQSEWFSTWFDSGHYERVYAHRDEAEARSFVERLIPELSLATDSCILDLGCGNGRHARCLASLGFRVTGIDISAVALARARLDAGSSVQYIQQDMRRPFGETTFDCVLNLATSFGYFVKHADHVTVANNIAQSLKVDGVLVCDYLNVPVVERQLVENETLQCDSVRYRITRWSDTDAFYKRIVVDDPSRATPLEYTERVAKLRMNDFEQLFEVVGLELEQQFGSYDLAPFDPTKSQRLILVAVKP